MQAMQVDMIGPMHFNEYDINDFNLEFYNLKLSKV